MFASGKQIQLKAKLNPADDSLTADIDVGITNGRFYFLNDLQEEWMSFDGVVASGSNFVYSNLVRGLSQTADPATAGTGLTWLAGNIGTLVQMHDQMADTKTSNTWTGTQTVPDIRFSGTTTSGLRVKSLTTAQRNALTAANGDIVYDSTEGVHYQYIGGAWSTFATGSVINASETEAGKVEFNTTAQSIAGNDTGETGALTVNHPSDEAKNIQSSTFIYGEDAGGDDTYVVALTPTLTTYTTGQRLRFKVTTPNTGACSVDFGPGVKSIKNRDGDNPINGQVYGIVEVVYDGTNMVLENAPTLATDAEATTGTVINKSISPKQGKDNYGQSGNINGTNATFNDTSAHSGTLSIDLGVSNVKTVFLSGFIYLGSFNTPNWTKEVKRFSGYFKLTGSSAIDFSPIWVDTSNSGVSNAPSADIAYTALFSGTVFPINANSSKITTAIETGTVSSSKASISGLYIAGTNLKVDYSIGAVSGPNGRQSGIYIGVVTIIN